MAAHILASVATAKFRHLDQFGIRSGVARRNCLPRMPVLHRQPSGENCCRSAGMVVAPQTQLSSRALNTAHWAHLSGAIRALSEPLNHRPLFSLNHRGPSVQRAAEPVGSWVPEVDRTAFVPSHLHRHVRERGAAAAPRSLEVDQERAAAMATLA